MVAALTIGWPEPSCPRPSLHAGAIRLSSVVGCLAGAANRRRAGSTPAYFLLAWARSRPARGSSAASTAMACLPGPVRRQRVPAPSRLAAAVPESLPPACDTARAWPSTPAGSWRPWARCEGALHGLRRRLCAPAPSSRSSTPRAWSSSGSCRKQGPPAAGMRSGNASARPLRAAPTASRSCASSNGQLPHPPADLNAPAHQLALAVEATMAGSRPAALGEPDELCVGCPARCRRRSAADPRPGSLRRGNCVPRQLPEAVAPGMRPTSVGL